MAKEDIESSTFQKVVKK